MFEEHLGCGDSWHCRQPLFIINKNKNLPEQVSRRACQKLLRADFLDRWPGQRSSFRKRTKRWSGYEWWSSKLVPTTGQAIRLMRHRISRVQFYTIIPDRLDEPNSRQVLIQLKNRTTYILLKIGWKKNRNTELKYATTAYTPEKNLILETTLKKSSKYREKRKITIRLLLESKRKCVELKMVFLFVGKKDPFIRRFLSIYNRPITIQLFPMIGHIPKFVGHY